MTAPTDDDFRTRHPTLWTVEALAWEYKEHEPEGDVLPAPKIQMGKRIQVAEVPDRPYAIAIAHHYLDRHAEEAEGRMSLEVHVHPPKQDAEGTQYEVSDEALEQARKLGIEGDVEEQVRRMARDATSLPQPNLRHGRYVLRAENGVVIWIGTAEPPRGRPKKT